MAKPDGLGVDRSGGPVVDPTKNVTNVLEAAVQRLDDLRAAEVRRVNDLAEQRHEYDNLLREAEAKRIDAIRAVDVAAVQRAAEVSAAQAQTLATQVAVSAEALRGQVAAAQSAAAVALAAALDPIQKDIADLRRVQYEQVGQKAQVVENRGASASVYAVIGAVLGFVGVATAIIVAVAK
jgi:hypothetical protein